MDRKMFRDLVKRYLRGATPQQCAGFASRIALRMLSQAVVTSKKQPPAYWLHDERWRCLMAILRGIVMGQMFCAGQPVDRQLARDIRENLQGMRRNVVAAAAAAAAAAAHADAFAAAITINVATDVYAKGAFGDSTLTSILEDAKKISSSNKIIISNAPLFHPELLVTHQSPQTPQHWQRKWLSFQAQMLELSPDFDLWIDWLNDRIAGKPWDASTGICWIDYPPEVAAGSVGEIKAYIQNRLSQAASKPLNQIRAIFIGYGNTGKTSIIRCLHGQSVSKEEDMTPGVAIRESLLAANDANKDLTTLFWDFGGQVVAHATHQFFLRTSCVYILVLSAREDKDLTADAEYWLQHVRAFGEGAPVLVVGNKSEVRKVKLAQQSLRDKYPNIVGFYDVSCWSLQEVEHRQAFNRFKTDLCEQLRGMSLHQMMFTPQQFAVLHAVKTRAKAQSLLPYTEFDEICVRQGIAEKGVQNRDWLMKTLDQLGVVIHFPKLPWMTDFVLNPRWLTWGVYTLMYGNQAELDVEQIKAELKAKPVRDEEGKLLDFDDDKARFIADAMVEFKLCYCLPDAPQRYVIPDLLATELPAHLQRNAWDEPGGLAYRMLFKNFVPRHLMPQMIVRRNREIVDHQVCQKAVLLAHADYPAQALLEVDYADRELIILLKGKDAREYLYELRLMLAEILQNMKLERSEEMRLPAQELFDREQIEWVNLHRLENMRRHGENRYYSETRVYHVAELVDLFLSTKEY